MPRRFVRLPLGLYRVSGESMLPTYRAGDVVVGWRWPRRRTRPGQVVVVRLPLPVVKRVVDVAPDGLWLEGDNPPASTDSRSFGLVPHERVEARVVLRLRG